MNLLRAKLDKKWHTSKLRAIFYYINKVFMRLYAS